MKKLILIDHLGNKLLEQDVFVEGQDFKYDLLVPVAYWLGTIRLVDLATLEKEEQERKEVLEEHIAGELIPAPEPEPEIVPFLSIRPDVCEECSTWEKCQGSNQEDCLHGLELTPEPEPEPEIVEQLEKEREVIEAEEAREDEGARRTRLIREFREAHPEEAGLMGVDVPEPEPVTEIEKKEVEGEPETTSDKSVGDKRTRKAKQPKSPKKQAKKRL